MTLIGATTENPYFEVNAALLSRTRVYELQPLSRSGSRRSCVAARSSSAPRCRTTWSASSPARRAETPARPSTSSSSPGRRRAPRAARSKSGVEDAARKRPSSTTRPATHYDFISAFIKSIRGSDPDAALFYLCDARVGRGSALRGAPPDRPRVGGRQDGRFARAARRDGGGQAVGRVELPEARLNLAHATIYLARAPKSRSVIDSLGAATADVREHGNVRPPKALRDAHYRGAKLGHGVGYVMPTDDPAASETDYLPDELKGRTYYEPSGARRGSRIARRLPGDRAASASRAGSARDRRPSSPKGSSRRRRPRAGRQRPTAEE